jgi:hypothetical protein
MDNGSRTEWKEEGKRRNLWRFKRKKKVKEGIFRGMEKREGGVEGKIWREKWENSGRESDGLRMKN